LSLIRDDLVDLKETYGDARRTRILVDETGDFNEEDLVKDEEILISITQRGYIKRVPSITYRSQGRGGRGITGMTTRDEDEVEFLFAARSLDTILYFTDKGKVYSEKAFRIPDASRTAKGVSIINLINIEPGEKITAAVVVPDFDQAEYLIMLTRNGLAPPCFQPCRLADRAQARGRKPARCRAPACGHGFSSCQHVSARSLDQDGPSGGAALKRARDRALSVAGAHCAG
jgi:hypothetical protein